MSKSVKVTGNKVTIETKSAVTAREIGAAAQSDLLKKEGGFAGLIQSLGEDLGSVTKAFGRGTFEGIALVMMVVGGVIAFVSWSRLLPLDHVGASASDPTGTDLRWLIGFVGVAIVIGVKVAAARWALRLNERDDAIAAKREDIAKSKDAKASSLSTTVWIGLVIDALAAFAFAAAVSQDAATGRIDYDDKIAALEREARAADYEAEGMQRPTDAMEILQDDLGRFLKLTAYNNSGQPTPLTRAEVIGWGVGEDGKPAAEPGENYCLPGSKYASYVDRYCEDAIELHRKVRQKQAWIDKQGEAEAKRAEAKMLRDQRPEAASAVALGGSFGGFGKIWKYIPPMALMGLIMLVMVYSSFVAKRDLEGDIE